MRHNHFFLGFFLLLSVFHACTEFDSVLSDPIQHDSVSQVGTKAVSEIFLHEDTGLLIQEQEDPFLAKNESRVTHRAIEFRPHSLEEYRFILSYSEDVLISYVPFGYSPVRDASEEDRGRYRVFSAGERYYIDEEAQDQDTTKMERSKSIESSKASRLPVLYATWPVDIVIPEDVEHTILGELSFPVKNGQEKEPSRFEGNGQINLPITVNTYDGLLSTYVPMTGIKVRVSYGSFFCDYTMGVYGSATIKPLLFNIDLTLSEIEQMQVYVIYQNPSVTVSRNNAITPIQKYLGTVSSLWGPMAYNTTYPTYTTHQSSQTNECDIFQAAYYYFNGSHDFSNLIISSEYGITIHASTSTPLDCSAETTTLNNELTIFVYDVFNNNNFCIGSVLHELGHVHHMNINSQFNTINYLIRDSFASYVGWYVGELYYYSKGYVLPFPGFPINDQNRQDWSPNSLENYNYSPLFVDLTDDYNQIAIDDPISGVPVSVINNMIASVSSVAACKSYLNSYAGTYFTTTELNSYFAYYE